MGRDVDPSIALTRRTPLARFPLRRGRRPVVALSLTAAAAVVLGALQIGAATPSTQSVAVPAKVGQSTQVTWSGTIPAASAHPTNSCNNAAVGVDDEGITVSIPRKGYDRFDAVFTFHIGWTPSNPTGDETLNDEVLTV